MKTEAKIADKSALVSVMGLGYVGLPLAVAFAEAGFEVLGYDMQNTRVNLVNQGKTYIRDISSEGLSNVVDRGLLRATSDDTQISTADVVCMCVPTPLTKSKQPDLSFVTRVSEQASANLQPGQLVVLESTTYPGTTKELVLPIMERSELQVGRDFYLAYSPERIDPGSKTHDTKRIPKVVGGIDAESTRMAEFLYQQIADVVVTVSSTEVAEMTKMLENVFRSVNIALVNELAQMCERMRISVWEVIDAAATKPYGYMPFRPGPGIGGHCIPLDPYYLASRAREYDFHARFIELAAETNEHMPYHVAHRIMEILSSNGRSLKGAKVLVLGVAYKGDVNDIRESPSVQLIRLLREKQAEVSYSDPYVDSIQVSDESLSSVPINGQCLAEADCVVIATDHSCFDYKYVVDNARQVFDTRGVSRGIKGDNVLRLGE